MINKYKIEHINRIFQRSGLIFSKKLFLIFFLLFALNPTVHSQSSDLEYGLLNVGISSVIGGVGAVINKQPEEEFSKVLLKGLAQGALGGYVVFESKRLLKSSLRTGNYTVIWPSKILNAAGNSIIENAARNDNFWVRWHLNFGFNRINFYTDGAFKIRYRILPFMFGVTIYNFIDNGKFSLDRSLKLGTIVFENNNIARNAFGVADGNIITLQPFNNREIEIHEIVHIYQYEQFSGINYFLDPMLNNVRDSSSFFQFYENFFETDFNYLSFRLFYNLDADYNSNIFEKEAYFFVIRN